MKEKERMERGSGIGGGEISFQVLPLPHFTEATEEKEPQTDKII
jgi:hypothetical protein